MWMYFVYVYVCVCVRMQVDRLDVSIRLSNFFYCGDYIAS